MMSSDWRQTPTYLFLKFWLETQQLKACTSQHTSKLHLQSFKSISVTINNSSCLAQNTAFSFCVSKCFEEEEYEGCWGKETGNTK